MATRDRRHHDIPVGLRPRSLLDRVQPQLADPRDVGNRQPSTNSWYTSSAGRVLGENAAIDEVIDVAQRGILRAFTEFRPLRRREPDRASMRSVIARAMRPLPSSNGWIVTNHK